MLDLLDIGLFSAGDPDAALSELRVSHPVFWQEDPGFFAILTYSGITEALRAVDALSSASGTELEDLPEDYPRSILHMDPPRHTKVRKLLGAEFAPSAVARMEPRVRSIACSLVETVSAHEEVDFAAQVADVLPMRVIGRLIGIPEADDERFKRWNTISIVEEPYGPVVRDVVAEMIEYFSWLRAQRLERPEDDIATRLAYARIDGAPLDDAEYFGNLRTLMTGGQDTTSNLISGGLLELSRHPDAMGDLRRDPSLLPTALEEMIRFVPSVIWLGRRALRDLEIEQTAIPAGSTVTLFFVSANRDERVFNNPGRFDIRRTPNPHLGFGLGRHFCIGAALARLEARVMFEELLPRLSRIEVGEVRRLRSNIFPGIDRMMVLIGP
jgi:cholest-4-en-3-one 26-monooxygenase